MRVRVEESHPGELTGLSESELRERVQKATSRVVEKLAKGELSKAEPATPRGGEIRVLDELGEMIVEQYEARLGQLRKAVLDTAREP